MHFPDNVFTTNFSTIMVASDLGSFSESDAALVKTTAAVARM
jgi:hypothetical protein